MTNPTKSAVDVYREISSIRFQKQPHDSSYEAATVIDQALQAAREEERERCAKIAEEWIGFTNTGAAAAKGIAAGIRREG